ncbi:MAG: pitrilysin family protein [Bacteroidota bacterium]
MQTTVEQKTFEQRIREVQIGQCRLLMLRSEVENVVSWQGSFFTYPDFAAGEELMQSLVVSLLDKGTVHRDKFAIADVLENKGAEVRFQQRGIRVGFSGQALWQDFESVFEVFAEQLFAPKMASDEFEKSRMRITAAIQRNRDRTGVRASESLRDMFYDDAHPNYSFPADDEMQALQNISVDDLKSYHANHFGSNGCVLVVVGDIDMDVVEQTVTRHFSDWQKHSVAPAFATGARAGTPQAVHVPMADKFNLDVKMGHPIALRRGDADFTALYLGNFMLGGNFSSRLMDIIRDEMGLTYGVGSSLPGVSKYYDGHWQISITLSQDKLEEGIAATQKLVAQFVEEGVSAEEVEEKKTTITGTYKVQMGTTRGLASTILRSLERGFDKKRLDNFPDEVHALTTDDINRVLRKHLKPANLCVVSAGTRSEDGA